MVLMINNVQMFIALPVSVLWPFCNMVSVSCMGHFDV
jgi:hypothetical protein